MFTPEEKKKYLIKEGYLQNEVDKFTSKKLDLEFRNIRLKNMDTRTYEEYTNKGKIEATKLTIKNKHGRIEPTWLLLLAFVGISMLVTMCQ